MNVLAVGCHPDDLEMNCGGTLAKCAARGDKVTMVTLASGNVGHKLYTKEEIAAIRVRKGHRRGLYLSGVRRHVRPPRL